MKEIPIIVEGYKSKNAHSDTKSMFKLFKKERTKEINIQNSHSPIPYSSVLMLAKYSCFEETFFNRLGNEKWNGIVYYMFSSSLINLLNTGKIQIIYYEEKVSILYNLINYKKDGYSICAEDVQFFYEGDILEYNILSILKYNKSNKQMELSAVLKQVINIYLGTDKIDDGGKIFTYEYLIAYAKKNPWLQLTSNDKSLGLIINYNFEIPLDKKNELQNLRNDLNNLKFQLRQTNLVFRNFLKYLEQSIERDFNFRQPTND